MRKSLAGLSVLCLLASALHLHAQGRDSYSAISSFPNQLSVSGAQSSSASAQPSPASTQWSSTSPSALSPRDLSSDALKLGSSTNETGPLTSNAQQLPPQQGFPTAPPSEFQKYVAATTGQRLEIYGASLFRNIPASFEPNNLIPGGANYVIGPDDELRVRIWGAINYSGNLRVDRAGNIFLPQVGAVHVAGLSFADLEPHLRAATGRTFRNFSLSAELGRIRSIQIYVTGQARRPGAYTISALSTLVNALFASGGPSPQGSLRHLQIKRAGKLVADFDLYALLLRGDKANDVQLQAEDVLFIPPVGAQVAIWGSIRTPAIFEMRSNETLNDLVEAAGGLSALTARTQVTLDRMENNQRRAMDFPLNASGLALHLADSDIVRVFSILPSYQNSVTLRGSVANAGRYGWRETMRLSDLLPDRESLMSRDYWWKRNHLGLATPDFEPQVATPDPLLGALAKRIAEPRPAAQPNADNSDRMQSGQNQREGNLSDAANNRASNSQLLDGSSLASRNANNRDAGHASLALQNQPEGEIDPASGLPVVSKNTVRIVAPEIDWNYAVIERVDPQTLKTSLIPFDLGKLVLQHDESQNLELKAGDTVTVFSQADIRIPIEQQTKYVTLEGEIAHAGVYSVQPGESLRDLVQRAGGLTTKAYLFGSEFDRESARILQQQRINEYVQNLEMEVSRSTIAFANYSAMNGQSSSAAGSKSVQSEFLEQLRKVRASGRVVLNISANASTLNDIPAVALENGDRFVIPSRPATVNVIGAVYNQNTFLHEPNKSVRKYLQQAGGANRSADSKRTYVIRADGSVLNSDSSKSLWGGGFQQAALTPGDTIVVPDKNYRPNLGLKSMLEWTQMFSQLAMGAATISLLR